MFDYSYGSIIKFCNEHNIKLAVNYSNEKLNSSSKVLIICKDCNEETLKCLNYMIKTKCDLCKKCITKKSLIKQKKTLLERYGVEHQCQIPEVKNKIKETFINKYGVDNPAKLEVTKQKQYDTNLKRYGVKFLVHNEDIKKKMDETNIIKYGVDNVLKSKTIQETIKNTNIEKYGVDNPAKNKDVIEKMKNTNLERYGCQFPIQNKDIKQKMINTNIATYGYADPIKNEIIAEKILHNSFKAKKYTTDSGKILTYQGFENFALKEVLNTYNENDIVNSRIDVPKIFYLHNGKEKRHYVDIYVKSCNLCIEVKSDYTITLKNDEILLKQASAKNMGYNYEIWVYDRKGNKTQTIS